MGHRLSRPSVAPAWVDARASVMGNGLALVARLDVELMRAFSLGSRWSYSNG